MMIKITLNDSHFLADNPPILQSGLNIISCPTGKGKTTWFTSLESQKVLVLPTNSLISQQVEILRGKGLYVGQCDQNDKTHNMDNDIILTTPESSYKVAEMIRNAGMIDKWVLGIDEWHNMALSQGYREKGYTKALLKTIALNWGCIVGLTGTPIPSCHPIVKNANIVNVDAPTRVQPYSIMRYDTKNYGDLSVLNHLVKPGESVGIFCNSKGKKLDKIRALLSAKGIGPDSFFEFNANTKESDIAEFIYKNECLPNNVKVIIFTSVFAEGCNLQGHFDKLVFMPDFVDLSPQSYQQIANRFRDSAPYVYILSNTLGHGGNVEYNQFLDVHISNMSHLYQQWNHSTDAQKFAIARQYNNFESSYILLGENGEYHKNYFYADYMAIMDYASYCRRGDASQLVNHLKTYNWRFHGFITLGESFSMGKQYKDEIRDTLALIKGMAEDDKAKSLDQLSRGEIDPAIRLALDNISSYLQDIDPVMMPALTKKVAIEVYTACNGNTRKIKPKLKALVNAKNDSFTNQLVNAFTVGEVLAVDEVKKRILSLYKSDESFKALAINLYPKVFSKRQSGITDKKAMSLLRLFYDVERKRVTKNGKQESMYKLSRKITIETLCKNA